METFAHWEAKTSTRPILRQELREKLIDRLNQLLPEKLSWQENVSVSIGELVKAGLREVLHGK